MITKKIIKFLDLLEDKARARLSRHPLLYGVVSGVGIVMFYRGVWMVLDEYQIMTGWVTLVVATTILLLSGVFVYHFVGNSIIISGIKKDKKLTERVHGDVKTDAEFIKEILATVKKIEEKIEGLKKNE